MVSNRKSRQVAVAAVALAIMLAVGPSLVMCSEDEDSTMEKDTTKQYDSEEAGKVIELSAETLKQAMQV